MNESIARARWGVLSFLALFTSFTTLLCCAIPVVLVSLGMGMTLASLASVMPWFFQLSRHKTFIFVAGAFLIAMGFLLAYGLRPKKGCDNGSSCEVAGKYTRFALWLSLAVYLVGFFMAYLYLPIMIYLEP